MSLGIRYSNYDAFARSYTPQTKEYYEGYLAKLEELVLQYIPKETQILDLCCGRGKLGHLLQKKGYRVTGLDGSEVLLRCARENAPDVEFIVDDARYFKLSPTFYGVVSTSVALNHIMSIEELEITFQNVYAALLENGIFFFELSSEEDFLSRKKLVDGNVEDDYVWIDRSIYDREKKVFQDNYTQFQLVNGQWQRLDVTSLRKAYSPAAIKSILEKVGFTQVSIYDEERDLKVDERAGIACFVCRKPFSK